MHDLIADHHHDLFCLTETWLQEEDYVNLNESTPPSHRNYYIPCDTGQGGGVTAIPHSNVLINPKPKYGYCSFESLTLGITHQNESCRIRFISLLESVGLFYQINLMTRSFNYTLDVVVTYGILTTSL